MRCPHCAIENEDGASVCENCGTPLTAYGGQITGEVSEATIRKAAKLAVRPPAIPAAAALDVLVAVLGPLWALLSRFVSRPTLNAENTNYLGAAFGAVGVLFTAMMAVPLAAALCVIAWGVMTQRTWAWTAQIVTLVAVTIIGLTGWLIPSFFLRVVLLTASWAIGYLWIREDTRRWYGV